MSGACSILPPAFDTICLIQESTDILLQPMSVPSITMLAPSRVRTARSGGADEGEHGDTGGGHDHGRPQNRRSQLRQDGEER
jgi:hypothetical protein